MRPEFLEYLVFIPAAAICFYPMKNKLRYPLRQIILVISIVFLTTLPLCSFLNYRFGLPSNYSIFPLMVLLYFAYHSGLKVVHGKSLATFLWVMAFLSIVSNFASGFDAIHNPEAGANQTTYSYIAFQCGMTALFALLLYYPFTRWGSYLIDNLMIDRIWNLTSLFSLIFLIFNLLIRPLHYQTLYINRIFTTFWVTLSTMLLIWLLMSVIFYFIISGMLDAAKTRERNQFLEMQESQFLSQQKYLKEFAEVRHDFRQTIRTLQELIKAGDYEKAESFIGQYAEKLPQNEIVHYCDHNALNALLNFYAQLSAQQNIELILFVDLPPQLSISDVDLCGMVGNILENAITACQKMAEGQRWIQLTALTKNDSKLFIVATNSFDGKARMKDGQFLSTKRSGQGIGLASILSTAERCGGSAQFSCQGQEFYSDIVLPL